MGTHPLLKTDKPIVFFDTNCLLCNKTVQFVLKADKKKKFVFAGLSSKLGKLLLEKNKIEADSVVLFYQGKCYLKSDAVLVGSKILRFPFSLLQLFYIIPQSIRNWVYNYIAAHRKRWFGTTDHCIINSKEYSDRIIL